VSTEQQKGHQPYMLRISYGSVLYGTGLVIQRIIIASIPGSPQLCSV